MSRVPLIWMNVTTSALWKRPPVGVVRVERSLSAELEKLYGNKFQRCIWKDGLFVKWDNETEGAISSVEREPGKLASGALTQVPLMLPVLSKRQALWAVAQGLLSLMPAAVRPYANWALQRLRPRIKRALGSRWAQLFLRRVRRQPAIAQHATQPKFEPKRQNLFAPGDVLISVGLDWDYPFYKSFYSLRKEQQVRVVTCCYDLIPVLYPQYCVQEVANFFTSYFLDVADGSDLVLCISKQSEKDLLHMLEQAGGALPTTHVFPLGDNVPALECEAVSPVVAGLCEEPFILFVSSIERRKNHEVLYRAYHILCQEGKRDGLPKLVFVGMEGWGVSDLLKDIELDPLSRGLIVRLNHVSDTELRALYDAALFCVFPSLYEGWGLPVGEALSLGKPMLCSDRGSLPEVGGDLVRYVDPWSPRAWAEEIYKMATDDRWRSEWAAKAKAHYRARSWADAAFVVRGAIDLLVPPEENSELTSSQGTGVPQTNPEFTLK